ncbi:AbfB domain-containing protein [Paractinoplanes lichenicola]|uniref:AbfB domain-containing protein n=1 Tax=Paractinoplanes lichenicola TaxID=2802976 RepID=A0ABS1VS61_9ACTN|nr:AbfB domain-containing protein [Actinoplanes lichenicola]MBL7257391.1 AbfB domain-containing protein [Actinoplanes lichenicola]
MTAHPRRLLALAVAALTASAGAVVAFASPAAAFVPKTPPLTTPWTNQVSTTNPLPEYPRPQLTRTDWQSLNGIWQFAGASNINTPPTGQTLGEEILVPYPIESALSGIMRRQDYSYYKRSFTVPAGWSGKNVQLNFGAVDWQSKVWVNGTLLGTHEGGYDKFSYDITSALRSGSNEIIVGVWDPTNGQDIPVGKQRLSRGGIWYTPYSGIWQTVWLEPTNPARVTRLDTTPNVSAGGLDLVVQAANASGQQVTAQVLSGGTVVGSATGTVGSSFRIPVPNARLWTPDDPFLYDLRVTLASGDAVGGYFGMRSLGKAMLGGVLRPTLNGKFVFQLGTLDQGYWPDGISTAPTDAALRFDLEQQKALGFNMVRKHIKVESDRWFYHADRLGLMVWQDMPALASGREPSAVGRTRFEKELKEMIDEHKGITSIVQWVPFNEGWGEYDAGRIAEEVKSWDATRMVNHNSGSNCCDSDPDPGNGDVIDDHMYVGPGITRPPTATRFVVNGEYGGLGLRTAGHEWPTTGKFAYEWLPDSNALTSRYVQITGRMVDLINGNGLSGSVYTEPTDVEEELNGFFTYDRQIRKMDFARVREVNTRVLGAANGTTLSLNRPASLRVTTPGYTNRYLRHADGAARTDVITTASSTTDRQDATYYVRPGLSNASCYSFESRNFPGQYLRHRDSRVYREANNGGSFTGDATFCARPGLSGGGTSLESANFPGRYLRHRGEQVWVEASTGGSFNDDATWAVGSPLWRSGADLAVGQSRSFRVTTAGYDNRYLRHRDNLARTDVISASSAQVDRQDATWIVRTGLADNSCYTFESVNYPGQFLRHANYRLQKATNDGSATFQQDATFCAQPGLNGGSGNVSLESLNYPGYYWRHYGEAVYIATNGGGNTWDSAGSYNADVTWNNAAPLG